MSEMKHSPEPWGNYKRQDLADTPHFIIADANNEEVCAFTWDDPCEDGYHVHCRNMHANHTRIIECVNACEGMENPAEEIEKLRFLLAAKEQSYDEAVDIIADLERQLKKAQEK